MALVLGRPRDAAVLEGLPDWELVRRVQAENCLPAFAVLYSRHFDQIFRFVMRRVSGQTQLAEDLVADVFVKALEAISAGRVANNGHQFVAWLTVLARNRVMDYFKSGYFRFSVLPKFHDASFVGVWKRAGGDLVWPDQPLHGVHFPESSDSQADPAELVGDVELARQRVVVVARLMRGLTPLQQRCLVLRFWCGLTVVETAKEMGLSEGAVKAVSYRAFVRSRSLIRSQPGLLSILANFM